MFPLHYETRLKETEGASRSERLPQSLHYTYSPRYMRLVLLCFILSWIYNQFLRNLRCNGWAAFKWKPSSHWPKIFHRCHVKSQECLWAIRCVTLTAITRTTIFVPYRLVKSHDDVIKWKHFPRNWPFVRGIHRSPVNSPHKGQWRGAFMFSLICARINGWVNNCEAGDLRRIRPHYDVTVMPRGVTATHSNIVHP